MSHQMNTYAKYVTPWDSILQSIAPTARKSKGHLANVCLSWSSKRKVPDCDYVCCICNAVGVHYYHECPEAACHFCGAKGHIASRCDRDISRFVCKHQLKHGECRQKKFCRFAHLSSVALIPVCALVRQACREFPDEWGQVAHVIGGEDHHGAMLAFDVVYSSVPRDTSESRIENKKSLLDRVRNAPDGREIIKAMVAIQEEFASMGGSATFCGITPKPKAAQPPSVTSTQLPPGLLGAERMVPVALECPLCFEPCTSKAIFLPPFALSICL